MAKCNFTIDFTGDAANIVDKARAQIAKNGGTFEGDLLSGSFSVSVMGTIEGGYIVEGQHMNIQINSKPMMIPCNLIEKFMKEQLSGAVR